MKGIIEGLLYVQGDLDLDTCKMQLEEKNYETFSRIISQTKLKMGNNSSSDDDLGEGFTMEEDK